MERERVFQILILVNNVRVQKEIFVYKQIRRHLFVFGAQPVKYFLFKTSGASEQMRHVEFVFVFKGGNGTVCLRQFI